jgi:hypothetical protein
MKSEEVKKMLLGSEKELGNNLEVLSNISWY